MRHEHAITYQGYLTIAQLDYVAQKANKLGRFGKELVRVYEESDDEGTHVYFDVARVIGASSDRR